MSGGGRKRVCLGVVAGAHGVRGLVKVKPFTEEPEAVAAYGPVETGDGNRRFRIEAVGRGKGTILCRLEGIDDRDKAEALRGTELYVERAHLPEPGEDEGWYRADLVGLSAVGRDGRAYGRVVAVENFGAGDLLEIERPEGGTVYLPFTEENVPEVAVGAGRVVVDPPGGLFEEVPDDEDGRDG